MAFVSRDLARIGLCELSEQHIYSDAESTLDRCWIKVVMLERDLVTLGCVDLRQLGHICLQSLVL